MSGEYKRTFRIGRTKITTHVPEADPVFKGVMYAAEIEGGRFPDHVGHIKIKPDLVASSKRNHVVGGRCTQTSQGGSKIEIFAGSIKEAVDPHLVDLRATNVALHEIGHSLRGREAQIGAWLNTYPSEAWEEDDAEKYVKEAHSNYQSRNSQGKPRSWSEVLALRKQQQETHRS